MPSSPILYAENLTKSFQGLKAIDNVSLTLAHGEILGLIGPNGAGKTTLFNLLSGAFRPDSGHIYFCEKKITGLKPHEISKLGIGRTFQIVRPFKELTTIDNVTIGALQQFPRLEKAQRHAKEILHLLKLDGKNEVHAQHLTLPERKRLEVARSLATGPKVILLDEVMAGLRPGEVDEMVEVLSSLNKQYGLSMVVIEHVMRAVMRLSDHVLVLNHGKRVSEGKPEAVMKDPRVIECYLGEGAGHDYSA